MKNLSYLLYPLMALVFGLAACDNNNDDTSQGPLPEDPLEWVCTDSLASAPQNLIDDLCMNSSDFGQPLPANLQNPSPLSMLDDKNIYDFQMQSFLRNRDYAENGLGWLSDSGWRLTGPYAGPIGGGLSFGTHPAVRIYYSPEVIEWLCNGRIGDVPDGAMIVKENHPINDSLDILINSQGCMEIQADVDPAFWTIMIKSSEGSFDGWYWGGYQAANSTNLNPPVLDRSGITDDTLFFALGENPVVRNPDWYPTGYVFEDPMKIPDVVTPFAMYGIDCINCHSSAENEMTFSSLDNILGPGILYKLFDLDAPIEAPFIPIGVIHKPGLIPLINPTGLALIDASSLFPSPLSAPLFGFLGFYNQLDNVPFSQAWEGRLPAETYDHIVSSSNGTDKFLTSDQCIECHDATYSNAKTPNMILEVEDDESVKLINLSPYAEWRSSPMGLAGRDPIFFSQLQSETNNLPDLKACIETTCLHCHGVMGQRQLAIDTMGEDDGCKAIFAIDPPPEVPFGKFFSVDMVTQWPNSENNADQKYGALARDGISCTVCHHISDTSLGDENSYTGNFVTGPADEIIGPHEFVVTKPMENALGTTPLLADRIKDSDICSSCHNILLPIFDNEGNPIKDGNKNKATYEQTTHLEWVNSDFAQVEADFLSCQDCHMPTSYMGEQLSFKIANIESDEFAPTTHRLPDDEIALTTRNTYHRHSLHGLNIFLNQMFQQFPLILGIRQIDYMTGTKTVPSLITGRNSMLEMAGNETAYVDVVSLEITEEGTLRAMVKVTNKVGHFLPSGVGFRRVFIEFLVRNAQGDILWASGRTNQLGAILDGTTNIVLTSEQPVKFPDAPFQPHYQVINSENQVQIYQELVADSDGFLTTSFLRRVTTLKDNRLRGKGYDPAYFAMNSSPFIQELAEIPGEAEFDAYYFDPDLTGADMIEYQAALDEATLADVDHVEVTLYSQSIPPSYLQQRFRDANRGPGIKNNIERLYHLTSHLNVEAVDDNGETFIENWKLQIATECVTLDLEPCNIEFDTAN